MIYAPGAVARRGRASPSSGSPALLALLPHFEMRGFGENAAMPMLAMTCFTLPADVALEPDARSRALAIGGGTGNLVVRDAYDAAGGHEALKDAVVDDVALARLVRRSGGTTEVVRADDLVSLRMYHGLREVVEGFTKNAFAVFGRNYVVGFLVVAGCVVFHILPYVLALTGDRISIATVVLITVDAPRSSFARCATGSTTRSSCIRSWPRSGLWIFLRSIWLTGIRRKLLWRGRTYDARQTRFGAERR